MSRKCENTGFICVNCGAEVLPLSNGSYRNHCPRCLFSLHVDIAPGDRSSSCGGMMQPVGIRFNSRKGIQLIHRCMTCGAVKVNRASLDTVMPDDFEALLQLMKQNQQE